MGLGSDGIMTTYRYIGALILLDSLRQFEPIILVPGGPLKVETVGQGPAVDATLQVWENVLKDWGILRAELVVEDA